MISIHRRSRRDDLPEILRTGLLAGVLLTALYNYAGFGAVREFGYTLVPGLIEPGSYPYGG